MSRGSVRIRQGVHLTRAETFDLGHTFFICWIMLSADLKNWIFKKKKKKKDSGFHWRKKTI